jgi:hypothetical protein
MTTTNERRPTAGTHTVVTAGLAYRCPVAMMMKTPMMLLQMLPLIGVDPLTAVIRGCDDTAHAQRLFSGLVGRSFMPSSTGHLDENPCDPRVIVAGIPAHDITDGAAKNVGERYYPVSRDVFHVATAQMATTSRAISTIAPVG